MLNIQILKLLHVRTQHSTGLEISLNSNCQSCCSVACPRRTACMLLPRTTHFTKIKSLIRTLWGGWGLLSRSSLEMKITASVNSLQAMKQASNLHLQGGNDSSSLNSTPQPIFIHAYLWTIPAENCIFWPTYTFDVFQRQDCCRGRQHISQCARQKVWKIPRGGCLLTSDLVNEDARSNNASILWKKLFQLLLSHRLWESTDVQICISDGSWTWASIGNLEKGDKIRHTCKLKYLPAEPQRWPRVSEWFVCKDRTTNTEVKASLALPVLLSAGAILNQWEMPSPPTPDPWREYFPLDLWVSKQTSDAHSTGLATCFLTDGPQWGQPLN